MMVQRSRRTSDCSIINATGVKVYGRQMVSELRMEIVVRCAEYDNSVGSTATISRDVIVYNAMNLGFSVATIIVVGYM